MLISLCKTNKSEVVSQNPYNVRDKTWAIIGCLRYALVEVCIDSTHYEMDL